ncbi:MULTISPECIES: lipid asymmetry maintenance protein MlaB [Shewanella]|uniref:STAS domain-containing protein n=1 Tax=unclassified Shewanella TaxID=196818 RepID=UPI0010C00288|nr:STAS domain-containing protein [Shewanella sp. MEBiC00475]
MITFNQQEQRCIVSGRLTQDEVKQLWPKRHELFTASTQVIDLSSLEYADSAGVALLVAFITLHVSDGHETSVLRQLVNPSDQLKKIIELYDLSAFFN